MRDWQKRLERLEGRLPDPREDVEKHQRTEERRAEIIAELEAFEHRLRNMSKDEHEAWRESEEYTNGVRELEAELERRRRGGP